MDLKKEFSFDPDLANSGVWIPIGDGAELLVARMNNDNYRKGLRAALLPYSRRGMTLSEKQNVEVMTTAASQHVLLGWKGLKEDGKELKYSPEEAKRLFDEYQDFFQLVVGVASDSDQFRAEND